MAVAGASAEARIASSASRAPAIRAESSCPVAVTVKTFSRFRSTRTPRFCRTGPAGDGARGETVSLPAARRQSGGADRVTRRDSRLSSKRRRATAIPTAGDSRVARPRGPTRCCIRLTAAAVASTTRTAPIPCNRAASGSLAPRGRPQLLSSISVASGRSKRCFTTAPFVEARVWRFAPTRRLLRRSTERGGARVRIFPDVRILLASGRGGLRRAQI
jgi:hypothetical protein